MLRLPSVGLGRVALLACSLVTLAGCAPRGSTAGPRSNEGPDTDPFAFRPSPTVEPEPEKGDKTEPKWDVAHPPGPTKTVKIDTREGTWMSVDVSPDGKTIAFDLLGDLYTVPIDGGEAKPLTSGMPWDMQPNYSPDGRFIAFTSDRGGGDNIWVIPSSGGEARQVSKESFRLLNSPRWTPDGQFIVARKHFTATRSLGSGELWLYHVSGGKGVQLTEKPNDQKDVGEPAFSPDGRYVYFSYDATPGPVFEYNKDPHKGIYAIDRLDRTEGRTETFIAGPGGAVRPTPSPDGRSLAYVRRTGLHTSLHVHDVVSGADRAVFHGLDRDMQETWAIHGVYPQIDWTPDSKSIVFWAGGKLNRIDLGSAKVRDIPFHVADDRQVSEALRYRQTVHPDRFHTKMLRWVQVSPDGKQVVFQALGRLWIRDLPSGSARRLTTDDAFEFYPSWSRDGRFIVYTTWSDDAFGSVRIVGRRGGRSKVVSPTPGHYIDPVFSPDGRFVVYDKVGGGSLRSRQWSHEPGIYAVPARGGEARLVTRDGNGPQFGADPDRVFLSHTVREKDKAKVELRSIELDGSDPRTHLSSENATGFAVSPDGRWLAFRERFNAFVAPFPATGRPFQIGPEAEGVPVGKISRDAGEYIHWSGDARRVYWSLGSEVFARDLTDTFAFIEGGVKEPPPPPERGIDIGFDVASNRPKGTIALTGARIVTMRGDEIIEDGVVVVEGNRIAAVGPRDRVTVPAGARRIDVAGKTVIPGLVDVHAHGPQGDDGITPQHNWLHYATLAFGVTTVHDPSNDTAEIFAAAELARAGLIVAPRIFSTGTILYGAETPFQAVVENLDDARAHLRRMKAVGGFSVKSYNQPRRDQRQQIIAAARELEMMVVPEGGSLYHHDMTMVVDGHTGIEHAIPVAKGYADMIQLWAGTAVGYTPTIGVGYGGLWGENYWYAHTKVFEHPKLRAFVPPEAYEPPSRRRVIASRGDWNHFSIAALCKQLLDAGVSIHVGAHGQREGLAAHWELWMLAQGGMTPLQALRAGTLHGARYLGLDGDIGSIEVGKLADLAVIDGNVIEDIRKSDRVVYTMVNGRMFDATTMNEIGGEERKAPAFYWQR